jgi:hypothetical protein
MDLNGIGIRTGPGVEPLGRPHGRTGPEAADHKPDLKSLLSAEELAYFAELERIGPVTYGPKTTLRTDAPPPVLGQRIDVRA